MTPKERLAKTRELRDFLLHLQRTDVAGAPLSVFHESDLFQMAQDYIDGVSS